VLFRSAAILGPTVTGPVDYPTLVTSYSEYKAIFGAAFVSGGAPYEYLTSIAALNYFEQGGDSLLVTRVASGSYTSATASIASFLGSNKPSFVLETITEGEVMNNNGQLSAVVRGALPSGSSANIRWEVTNVDSGSGLFSLIIRRGDDYDQNKTVLETWNNISLDPNQNNFITYVIGDTKETAVEEDGSHYLQITGSYPNKSRYVRVKQVNLPTPGYLNQYRSAYAQYTASLPQAGSRISVRNFRKRYWSYLGMLSEGCS